MPFLESVRRAIQQQNLLQAGQTVVVGVSGGADSLALLEALYRLRTTFDVQLHIVTLDHGWRGAASAADAHFVAAQARRRDLPVTLRTLPPPTTATNLEAAGRKARYDLFAEVAARIGAHTIATGHHAGDQAETVLLRLLRGAGLHGLQGMGWQAPLPYHPEFALVRPLLAVRRTEIDAFCAGANLQPRHDPTNDDPTFLRNRVRHELVPLLQQMNPNITEALVRLADVASVESDYVDVQVKALLTQHATTQTHTWGFPRAALLAQHPALQRRVIAALAARAHAAPQFDVDYQHIVAAQYVAQFGEQGAVAQFPNGVQMQIAYDDLVFSVDGAASTPVLSLPRDAVLPLLPGRPVPLTQGWLLLAADVPVGYTPLGTIYLHDDVRPHVRTRKPGDRIALRGLGGHTQKLKDWMINRKIPHPQRDNIPIIVDDNATIMVVHLTESVVANPYHVPTDNAKRYTISCKL